MKKGGQREQIKEDRTGRTEDGEKRNENGEQTMEKKDLLTRTKDGGQGWTGRTMLEAE
jgi:hypothetical protein